MFYEDIKIGNMLLIHYIMHYEDDLILTVRVNVISKTYPKLFGATILTKNKSSLYHPVGGSFCCNADDPHLTFIKIRK